MTIQKPRPIHWQTVPCQWFGTYRSFRTHCLPQTRVSKRGLQGNFSDSDNPTATTKTKKTHSIHLPKHKAQPSTHVEAQFSQGPKSHLRWIAQYFHHRWPVQSSSLLARRQSPPVLDVISTVTVHPRPVRDTWSSPELHCHWWCQSKDADFLRQRRSRILLLRSHFQHWCCRRDGAHVRCLCPSSLIREK